MNKPLNPCSKNCQNCGKYCKICDKWKQYEIERQKYYNEKLINSAFISSQIERYNKIYCKNIDFKKGVLK